MKSINDGSESSWERSCNHPGHPRPIAVQHPQGDREFLSEDQGCFFSFALEGSETGVWVSDLINGIISRSLEHDRIFGYKSLLPVWNHDLFLAHVHPEDRPEVDRCFKKALASGGDWNFECRIRRVDGENRWIRSAGRHRLDFRGKPSFLTCIVQDVTSRKIAEAELRQARDELEHRVRERTAEMEQRALQLARLASELILVEQKERRRLAEILHDDLQQLLVAARIQLEQLRLADHSPDHHRTINLIHDTVDEAIESTRSLMRDLSPPVLYRSGLPAALHWLAKDILRKHQLTVDVRIDGAYEDLPESLNVFFYTVARELLFNVVKHAGISNAELGLRREGKSILLEVGDGGNGFDTCLVNKNMETGGFGLFSIRERTEFLGGLLNVESAPGRGSRFTVKAPVSGKKAKRREKPAVIGSETGQSVEPRGDVPSSENSSVRVLLVDDHRIMREGLLTLLEIDGVNVVGQADNGREAIACVERLQPDIVIMDVSMPVMDGIEATQIIKQRWPSIRIIALSMFEESELAARLFQAGANYYLTKTGPSRLLIDAIRQ